MQKENGMLTNKYLLTLGKPSVGDFVLLRQKVGWGDLDKKLAEASLQNSLYHATVTFKGKLIGMGRVIGDGAMYFYIQDVIVDPDHQNIGIGALIMDNIEEYLSDVAMKGATIGLLAAQGKENFYSKYDYIQRPNASLGHGMCKFL